MAYALSLTLVHQNVTNMERWQKTDLTKRVFKAFTGLSTSEFTGKYPNTTGNCIPKFMHEAIKEQKKNSGTTSEVFTASYVSQLHIDLDSKIPRPLFEKMFWASQEIASGGKFNFRPLMMASLEDSIRMLRTSELFKAFQPGR